MRHWRPLYTLACCRCRRSCSVISFMSVSFVVFSSPPPPTQKFCLKCLVGYPLCAVQRICACLHIGFVLTVDCADENLCQSSFDKCVEKSVCGPHWTNEKIRTASPFCSPSLPCPLPRRASNNLPALVHVYTLLKHPYLYIVLMILTFCFMWGWCLHVCFVRMWWLVFIFF